MICSFPAMFSEVKCCSHPDSFLHGGKGWHSPLYFFCYLVSNFKLYFNYIMHHRMKKENVPVWISHYV